MTQARGSLSQLVMLDETTLGTADGTLGLRLPFISYDVKLAQALKESRALQGNRNRTIPYLDEKALAGTCLIQPDVRSISHVMRHAIAVPVTTFSVGTPTVTAGGTGYTSAPAVGFTGGGGSGAAATAVLTGDAVTSFTITNAGSGYTSAPTVSFTGGGGSGATGTVAAAAPYVHEYKPGTLPVGMTLEPYFSDITLALQHAGCRINGFSFEVGSSGCLEMSLDIVGVDETNESRMDSSPLLYAVSPLKMGDAQFYQDGSLLYTGTKFSLQYSNDIEQIRTIGNGGKVYSLPEGFAVVNFSFEVLFESMTQYNKAKNATEASHKIVFPSAATGTGHQLEFEMQECFYQVSGPAIPGPTGIRVMMDGQAFYDNGAETASLVCRVTNDLAAAAVTAIAA